MTPESIRLGKANAAQILALTGFTVGELHAINRREWPGVVRQRGEGHGARYYLHFPTFKQYAARMKAAS